MFVTVFVWYFNFVLLLKCFVFNFVENLEMKKLLMLSFAVAGFLTANAQSPFTCIVDSNKVTILNGILHKNDIATNAAFKGWYSGNQYAYIGDTSVTNIMAATNNKVQYVIFGGTWCEDTQSILPKFFKLQEQSGLSENNISLYGVDRNKKTLGNITAAFKITNVPTIIVMKDGKEIGRVVEYGKTGKWDTELAQILKMQ